MALDAAEMDDESLEKLKRQTRVIYSILLLVLLSSLLVNFGMFTHLFREKQYKRSYHMVYLNLVAADIALALFGSLYIIPGRKISSFKTRDSRQFL